MALYIDVRFFEEGQGHHLIIDLKIVEVGQRIVNQKHKHNSASTYAVILHTNLHNPILEKLHRDISYKHGHFFGPGHSFASTIIISSVNTAKTNRTLTGWGIKMESTLREVLPFLTLYFSTLFQTVCLYLRCYLQLWTVFLDVHLLFTCHSGLSPDKDIINTHI